MNSVDQVADLLAQCIRVGFVTARQPETMRVRVQCPDSVSGPLVTDWLPVLTPRASGDRQYDLPDVGDQVLCLFLPHGREAGFVLGGMYGGHPPPAASGDIWRREFRDGSSLEYDRAANRLSADIAGSGVLDVRCAGPATLRAEGAVSVESAVSVTLKAPSIILQGNLTQTGHGGGAATSDLRGTFTVIQGDVRAEGVSLTGHVHVGVEPGPGSTGGPQ